MRLHHIDLEMNFQTRNQEMNAWAGYFERHLQLHCCALLVKLLQLRNPKSLPAQEMVAVWTFFYYGIACLCEHPILLDIGDGILDSRILDSPPPLQIHLDPYASLLAWSRTSQIRGSLLQIMCSSLEYPNEGRRISLAPSLPIQKFPSRQGDDKAQLQGDFESDTLLEAAHCGRSVLLTMYGLTLCKKSLMSNYLHSLSITMYDSRSIGSMISRQFNPKNYTGKLQKTNQQQYFQIQQSETIEPQVSSNRG